MSNLKAYWIKKIGLHRGSPRIWLDMPRLAEAGLKPGSRYELEQLPNGVRLLPSELGSRSVSTKSLKSGGTLPIIDINCRDSLKAFDGHGHVRVIIRTDAVYLLMLASELCKRERLDRVQAKIRSGQQMSVASLSHGVGVLSYAAHVGLREGGIDNVMAVFNEIHDGYATQSILNNPATEGSVPLCVPMQELVQDGWALKQLPKVEVMELGLPCSGASIAGKSKLGLSKMEDHPQVGHLVHAALVLVGKLQPAVLVLENVEEYARSASAQLLRHQLSDMGYQLQELVLRAQDFGALESRVRWALVATTEGVPLPGPLSDWSETKVPEAQTLGAFLDEVPLDDPSWSPMTYLREKEERDRAGGKGFMMQLVDAQSTQVPTIRKQYNKGGSTDPYVRHPEQTHLMRKFTPAEHARIKGVPADLVGGMSVTGAHEALGQGIVVAPFRALFRRLGECLRQAACPSRWMPPPWASPDGAVTG